MSTSGPRLRRLRRSLTDIQADYDRGDKAELETLMRAWRGIKALPPDDPRSFFMLGGFHGEPFRGQGTYDSAAWWGGYCQHGTVLFPTWHRAYLYRLEQALQSIDGCSSVALPFWDECSVMSQENGIPRALTDATFELDGEQIDNPLRSFVLPMSIVDRVAQDNLLQPDPNAPNYSKPAGYETVRYPLSGLVGTAADQKTTAEHNAGFPNYAANVKTLDANIMAWLTLPVVTGGVTRGLVVGKFVQCMDAPTYTLFSNTTSARAWNSDNPTDLVVPLESPHNFMHLAVGGFDIPTYNASPIVGANGDMGENDTAALDPIFFFHHCFIDYAFWTWQRRYSATESLTIDQDDPGASYAQNQVPAGGNPGDLLTMTRALMPFTHDDGSWMTSADCVNIEEQLGYHYGPGSLDEFAAQSPALDADAVDPTANIHITGIDRSKVPGSFIVAAYREVDGVQQLVGADAVLSRWTVSGCANCQTHLRIGADFAAPSGLAAGDVTVLVHTRRGTAGQDGPVAMVSSGQLASAAPADLQFGVAMRS